MKFLSISSDRYNIKEPITKNELLDVSQNDKIKYLQISNNISQKSWKLINRYIVKQRDDIEIRLLHFIRDTLDLSVLKNIKSVKKLSLDHILSKVENFEYLMQLSELESFGVSIFDLESFDFIDLLNIDLKSLSIGKTKSAKPDIQVIKRFKELEILFVEGHTKNINVISNLEKLESLTLRSIKLKNLNFIKNLNNLKMLDLKLGSIIDSDSISFGKNLKYLELWQVRGIETLDFLEDMKSLDTIFLQNLKHIDRFPTLSSDHKLRVVHLESMKSIGSLDELQTLRKLEELYLIDMGNMSLENCYNLLENSSIKQSVGYFGSKKRNELFKDNLMTLGIKNIKSNKQKLRNQVFQSSNTTSEQRSTGE